MGRPEHSNTSKTDREVPPWQAPEGHPYFGTRFAYENGEGSHPRLAKRFAVSRAVVGKLTPASSRSSRCDARAAWRIVSATRDRLQQAFFLRADRVLVAFLGVHCACRRY
jgi:hypothetical protein